VDCRLPCALLLCSQRFDHMEIASIVRPHDVLGIGEGFNKPWDFTVIIIGGGIVAEGR
jgi:hypothetical protein